MHHEAQECLMRDPFGWAGAALVAKAREGMDR